MINDAIIIQQCHPGVEYPAMIEMQRDRNINYAIEHKFDYQCLVEKIVPEFDIHAGAWDKVELVRRALVKGYRYVIWLDADALIWDMSADLRDGCPRGIGACWHRYPALNHWNVGVMYFSNAPGVLDLMTKWLSYYPGLGDGWNEQGVYNKLAREHRFCETISDKWNATLNMNMVPDAVVLGFHGVGNPAERLEVMRQTLARK